MAARARAFPSAVPTPPASRPRLSRSVGAVVPAWLEPRLGSANLRVVDVRAGEAHEEAFRRRHLPGAVLLDVQAQLFDTGGGVVSAPELAMVMSTLGVGDSHTIVLVDDGPPDAALTAAWALDRYGHHDVYVLDGGITRWVAEGRPVTREVVRHPPASFTAKVSA